MTHITDAELLEYLDGAAAADLARRIESDPQALARAQGLRRLQAGLRARLQRADCPDSLQLGEYQTGRLHGSQALLIRQHVAACRFCRAELEQLRTFLIPEEPGLAERVRVVLAQLLSGSLAGGGLSLAPALGQRGSDATATYSAGELQIVLSARRDSRHPGQLTLAGLVVGEELEGAPVRLSSGEQAWSAQVDELGTFSFGELAAGEYELSLETPAAEIRLPGLAID